MNAQTTTSTELDDALRQQFGTAAHTTPLAEGQHMGVRVHGIDLTQPLSVAQAELLVSLLDHYSIMSFPNQGSTNGFRLRYLERLANHFGAPIPHPKNYANYIEYKDMGYHWNCRPMKNKPRACVILPFPMTFGAWKTPKAQRSMW